MSKPKLFVLGYKRHGKDTVCEMIRDTYGLSFSSSSWAAAEHVVLPYFKRLKAQGFPVPAYKSVKACFDDRDNWRSIWFDAICAFNEEDPARLSRQIFAEHYIYAGLRNVNELVAARAEGLCDAVLWIDASKRLPPEDADSCTVTMADADIVLDNNGPEANLPDRLAEVFPKVLALARKRASLVSA